MAGLLSRAAGLMTAATLALLGGAASAQQAPLRIGAFDKDRSQFGTGAAAFCQTLSQRTRSRWRCERLGDSLGTSADLLEALKQGKLDVVNVPAVALQPMLPEVGVFDIPFLFRSEAHARRTLDGYIGHDLLRKLEQHGLVGLAWTEGGLRHITNSRRAIVAAGDVRGLRLRTQDHPQQAAAWRALQVEPKPMPFALMYEALAKGEIDGQENLLEIIADANLARVQKHLSLTGHLYEPGVIVLSAAIWGRLTADERQRFIESARRGAAAQRRKISRENRVALSVLKRNGMQIVQRVDTESFRIGIAPAYAEYARTFGADRLAAIQAVK